MARLRLSVAGACDESVTAAVKLKVPMAVGVPERRPLLANVIPPGSIPADMFQEYPLPVPPVAARVAEYGTVTVPPARDVVVTVSGVEVEGAALPPQPGSVEHANAQCSATSHLPARLDRRGQRRARVRRRVGRKRGLFISCSVRTRTPSKRLLYKCEPK